jgi:hypothetical protein
MKLLFIVLILVAGSWSWSAAQSPDCLGRAAGIEEDSPLLIIGRNGQRFAGRLVAVNSEERILGLISESQLGPYTREIPFDAIDEIQYTAPGRIQGSYVFWGFLVGAAAGALIGQTVDSGKEVGSDSGGAVTGAAIGAGVGILVSGGISFFVPSKRRIRCAAEE